MSSQESFPMTTAVKAPAMGADSQRGTAMIRKKREIETTKWKYP